jgi:cyanophycin synthetase
MDGLIAALGRSGRLGRQLGARLDLGRALGVRRTLQRRRDDAREVALWDARRDYYRRLWREAASAVEAELVELEGAGEVEARRGGGSVRIVGQRVEIETPQAIELSMDKAAVHGILARASLPVPEHVELRASDLAAAGRFLDGGGPCAVKPARGTGASSGVTTGIRTRAELARAWLRAGRLSSWNLVERHVAGEVYRVLVLDGEVLDVVRRRPPLLVGDGRSTIEQLVRRENLARVEARGALGLSPLRLDLDLILTLERQGLGLGSVPAAETTVEVKGTTQQNRSQDNVTVALPPPRLVGEVARAAGAVGLRLAGVDVIATTLAGSLAECGGVVLEVNADPGLHHHYRVAEPASATPVAELILDRLLPPAAGRATAPPGGAARATTSR